MNTGPRYATRSTAVHIIWLIPDVGRAKRLKNAWSDPQQALRFGIDKAHDLFSNTTVEVAVVHRMSNEMIADTKTAT